tara:strand:+ start:2101 stop:3819 length:1719 start_codon:yes stop_codon:yes gene_type:complete
MKFLTKKIYIILFFLATLLMYSKSYAKDSKILYTRENISNYFLGIVSSNQYYNDEAFRRFKKIKALKNEHSNFNIEFVKTLVLLEKFEEAFSFSKEIWTEEELFFEADLLLGLNFFIKKDFKNAEKHFKRLNEITRYNLFFRNFVGNVLIAWTEASKGNQEKSFDYIEKIPKTYRHLTNTQKSFLLCYFNSQKTKTSFEKLILDKDYNFSRYNFFLANYLLFNNNKEEAKKVINQSSKKYNSNLLIKQTEIFFSKGNERKIKNFFNCKNPNDTLAEFFYILANLYSSEKEYQMSNFYLKISLFLNNNFLPNKALLAENFYYQKKNKKAKRIYESLQSVGSVYSWYSSKSIASILLKEKGKKYSVKNLEDEFKLIENPSFENYFELANFYKDNEYFEESIKYYTLTLNLIEKDHFLVPKILDRRGTSYERIGEWESAEKDLTESLKISPDQAHVLNYLAYTWIDQGINLDKGLEMLKKATQLREDDGYIIDSLGWAYFAKKNYIKAEEFLQRAVELLPSDPVINDHYADALWMLNKDIQARYVWKYVLKLESTEQKLKDIINKKLIFGIARKT